MRNDNSDWSGTVVISMSWLDSFDSLILCLHRCITKQSSTANTNTEEDTATPHVLAKGTQIRSSTKKARPTAFSHSFNPLKRIDFPLGPSVNIYTVQSRDYRYRYNMSTTTQREEPSAASGSRTPRPITLSPSPPCSPRSMTRTMEPDSMVLLRTIDFAARVCSPLHELRMRDWW